MICICLFLYVLFKWNYDYFYILQVDIVAMRDREVSMQHIQGDKGSDLVFVLLTLFDFKEQRSMWCATNE